MTAVVFRIAIDTLCCGEDRHTFQAGNMNGNDLKEMMCEDVDDTEVAQNRSRDLLLGARYMTGNPLNF